MESRISAESNAMTDTGERPGESNTQSVYLHGHFTR